MEIATFAGGCFWCTEALFQKINGVEKALPGYSGGNKINPTYEEVCSGKTGHAEVVQIYFNPKKVTFKKLLEVFFYTHDPTTINRQGNDVGSQYRSVVFYHNNEQKMQALKIIQSIDKANIYKKKIVTKVLAFNNFYEAEDYHKNYYEKNKDDLYCNIVIEPKLKKLFNEFGDILVN